MQIRIHTDMERGISDIHVYRYLSEYTRLGEDETDTGSRY